MNTIILLTILALGLSESIETRLPQDPGMIYTVGFEHEGVQIGLDWKNRQIMPARVCRKSTPAQRLECLQAASDWLHEECAWYQQKGKLLEKQADMKSAVCTGATKLSELIRTRQLADR